MPDGYTILLFGEDHVWGTRKDELDVQYVFLARIVPQSSVAGGGLAIVPEPIGE